MSWAPAWRSGMAQASASRWAYPESSRMSPSGMPASGMAVSTGTRARAGSVSQEQTVIRWVSSGTGGPCSSRIMVPADR